MILAQNILVGIIALIWIPLSVKLLHQERQFLKTHLILLSVKLSLVTAVITLFVIKSPRDDWGILILSGVGVLIGFHFIEGIFVQRQLIRKRNSNA